MIRNEFPVLKLQDFLNEQRLKVILGLDVSTHERWGLYMINICMDGFNIFHQHMWMERVLWEDYDAFIRNK